MKINNNRLDGVQAQGYFNATFTDDIGANTPAMANTMGESIPGVVCEPIYECPKETVVNRYICHEVPHD